MLTYPLSLFLTFFLQIREESLIQFTHFEGSTRDLGNWTISSDFNWNSGESCIDFSDQHTYISLWLVCNLCTSIWSLNLSTFHLAIYKQQHRNTFFSSSFAVLTQPSRQTCPCPNCENIISSLPVVKPTFLLQNINKMCWTSLLTVTIFVLANTLCGKFKNATCFFPFVVGEPCIIYMYVLLNFIKLCTITVFLMKGSQNAHVRYMSRILWYSSIYYLKKKIVMHFQHFATLHHYHAFLPNFHLYRRNKNSRMGKIWD